MTRRRKAKTGGQDAASRIAVQHHDLRQVLAVINRTEELVPLVAVLRDLRTDLAAHFADEEREDGLAQAVAPTAPHHMRRLEALMAEHAQLLASVDQLIQRGEVVLDGPVKQLVAEARALTASLARHEAAETELLTDSLYAEIGGG